MRRWRKKMESSFQTTPFPQPPTKVGGLVTPRTEKVLSDLPDQLDLSEHLRERSSPFGPDGSRSTGLVETSPRTEQPFRTVTLPEPWICRSISANGATPSVLSIKGTIEPSAPCVDAYWSVRPNIFAREGRLALEIAQRVFSSPSQPHFWAASPENARITLLQGRHGMQHRTGEIAYRGGRTCLE